MATEQFKQWRNERLAAAVAQGYAGIWFVAALVLLPFLDPLTNVLLLLSTFLFAVVVRYSVRYLMGDSGYARFLGWLCATSTFVFALVLAENLAVFAVAWCGISLSLHRLLQFYGERPRAVMAARKKFLISRLGDAALFAAAGLTLAQFGTWDFAAMFAGAERLRAAMPTDADAVCLLLVFAALLKSAQFPFHSWLPDTMETPTPVSAFMHAGIINAGGILLIRLSPLIALSAPAMTVLCVVGGFTALFASVVMLTQASVKRYLAFSTVAQMGFMMLECGLGAFHLALVHLVAHSLYKAYAFLSSGGAVLTQARAVERPGLGRVLGALVGGLAIGFGAAPAIAGADPTSHFGLNLMFSLAVAQMMWAAPRAGIAAVLGLGLGVVYFTMDRVVAHTVVAPLEGAGTGWIAAAYACGFLALALLQTRVEDWAGRTRFAQWVYVAARNGFYVNTVANRVTARLWPRRLSREAV